MSPTLANATLDGMERMLRERYQKRYMGKGKFYFPKVNLIRYADDFVVTAGSKGLLEEIKPLITDFLTQRGLSLSEEKTLVTHICEGFDFLGFNIRKYNGKLLIKPSKKSRRKIGEKLHGIISGNKSATQGQLIGLLNPVITGWGNYFKHVVSKDIFAAIDHVLVLQLKRWAFRRHTDKSREWVKNKYFQTEGNRKWVFAQTVEKDGGKKTYTLRKLADIPITRHLKIKMEANPFDGDWYEYFDKRQSARLRFATRNV
nr:group II intron maturase-specific domain-containing protein [uncultured Proteiniphilum sp.]